MRGSSKLLSARLLALAAGGFSASAAFAQTATNWINPASGNWSAGSNWSSGVPNNVGASSFAASITTPGAYTVTLDGAFSVTDLTLGSGAAANPGLSLNSRTLTVRRNYTQNGASLLGVPASPASSLLSIGGAATLSGAILEDTRVQTRGALTLAGADNDICDTDMDHRGSTCLWTGPGNILFDGNARFTNGVSSTFTISNDQRIISSMGAAAFVNNGRIVKQTGAGITLFDLQGGSATFANNGTLEVQSGTFRVSAGGVSTSTLTGTTLNSGVWKALSGRSIDLVGASITTNNADVTLSGAGANLTGIAALQTNGATGKFTIQSGFDFTTAGAFTNSGALNILNSTTFTVAPGSAFNSFAAGVLGGGSYTIQGKLLFDGAAITQLNTKLTLDGAASLIAATATPTTDALANLNRVQSGAELSIKNSRNFTASAPTFTLDPTGKLSVGTGTTLTLNTLANFAAGTLTDGVYNVQGQLRFSGSNITTLSADLTLDGAAAKISDATGTPNLLGSLATISTSRALTVKGGQIFTTSAPLTLSASASLTIGAASTLNAADLIRSPGSTVTVAGTLQYPGAAFTSVPTGVIVQPGGRILNGAVDAFAALDTIQSSAQFSVAAAETRTLNGNLTTQTNGNLTVGQLGVPGAATINIPGNYTQNGSTQLNTGNLNVTGTYFLNGATTGIGNVTAGAIVIGPGGLLAPGNSPGQFSITGNTTMSVDSGFKMEVGAPDSIDGRGILSDFMTFSGDLTIGDQTNGFRAGLLQYSFVNAFDPEIGDTFILAHVTGIRTGEFAGIASFNTGILCSAAWVGQDLVLTVTALPTPGAASLLSLAGLVALRRRR